MGIHLLMEGHHGNDMPLGFAVDRTEPHGTNKVNQDCLGDIVAAAGLDVVQLTLATPLMDGGGTVGRGAMVEP